MGHVGRADSGWLKNGQDALTLQRFEAKYRISELKAVAVREFILPYVSVDSHVRVGSQYAINSLYFDSPSLALYRGSVTGLKDRVKLRIRSYTEEPEEPVFFEIKRRLDRAVSKQRGRVGGAFLQQYLQGASNGTLLHEAPATEREAVHAFWDLADRLYAEPKVYVRYKREAYESRAEEGVRITFDRQIQAAPYAPGVDRLWQRGGDWRDLDKPEVVLEVKFTGAYPYWVQQMIQRFSLLRGSMSKYVASVELQKYGGLYPPAGCRRGMV